MHRVLLVIVLSAGSAHAKPRGVCQLHVANAKVTTLGCFEDVESTGDHTYGRRMCFVVSGAVCTGLLYEWDGNLEANVSVMNEARCSAKGGTIAFNATRTFSTGTGTRKSTVSFAGRLGKRIVTGALLEAGQRHQVKLRQMKRADEPGNVVERIRELTAVDCRTTD